MQAQETRQTGPEERAEGQQDRNTRMINKYVALTMEKRKIQARERVINQELATLEDLVKDIMGQNGWSSVSTEDGVVFIRREVFARLRKDEEGSYESAYQALREAGLEYMVKDTVNTQTLTAYVREQEDCEEPLPQTAEPWILKEELFRARVRAPAKR